MKKIALVTFAGALGFASCTTIKKDKDNNLKELTDNGSTVDFKTMDESVSPKEDFYTFANGTWVKENPVPDSETRWGTFNELDQTNKKKLKAILENAAKQKNEKGSIEQLIGDYYFTFMDTDTRNKLGLSPIKGLLAKIDAVKNKAELANIIGELHNNGLSGVFGCGVEQDFKNNTRHRIYISQGGLGLPGKEYYTKDDEESKDIQQEYIKLIENLLKKTNLNSIDKNFANSVYEFENNLAKASMGRVELRDYMAQYNPYHKKEQADLTSNFKWDNYYKTRGLSNFDTLIVMQPDFMTNMNKMLASTDLETWKNYLKWKTINGTAHLLSDEFVQADFDFYSKKLRGQKNMKEQWKRGIDAVSNSAISEALGHAFVNKYFTPEAKTRVNIMVDNILVVYKERIEKLTWMSDETKKKALHKLSSFSRKLGYPDVWTDFSNLSIDRNSYAQNVLNCDKFLVAKNTKKLHEAIDKNEWGMAPHIVNAYYNPLLNEIVFPAGIMQPPFFDVTKEDAVNYARMGAVIGHELTHGFDDQGAQFTAEGTFENWWQEEDLVQFNARTQKLINQYNSFEALPGLNVNGKLTLGENIADFGGLTIAYHAYQKCMKGKERTSINGYTNEQRFFISFAQIWRTNYTDGAMKMQVNTNPHSPGMYRVIGTLANMPEFFETFDVKEGDKMRQPEDKIAIIW